MGARLPAQRPLPHRLLHRGDHAPGRQHGDREPSQGRLRQRHPQQKTAQVLPRLLLLPRPGVHGQRDGPEFHGQAPTLGRERRGHHPPGGLGAGVHAQEEADAQRHQAGEHPPARGSARRLLGGQAGRPGPRGPLLGAYARPGPVQLHGLVHGTRGALPTVPRRWRRARGRRRPTSESGSLAEAGKGRLGGSSQDRRGDVAGRPRDGRSRGCGEATGAEDHSPR
mmetsp:Transcript_13766/g.43545  ORF Transcript_13766/g.43545 Transcript_13766/m.43545 type:complete len:224 (-) Transcript_13766:221-892(-)